MPNIISVYEIDINHDLETIFQRCTIHYIANNNIDQSLNCFIVLFHSLDYRFIVHYLIIIINTLTTKIISFAYLLRIAIERHMKQTEFIYGPND